MTDNAIPAFYDIYNLLLSSSFLLLLSSIIFKYFKYLMMNVLNIPGLKNNYDDNKF
jgi:hypothetical protein